MGIFSYPHSTANIPLYQSKHSLIMKCVVALLVIGAVMAAAEAYRGGGRGYGGRGYGGRGIGGRGYGGGYRGKRSADAEADAYYGYGGYGGYGYGGIHHYGKRSADAYRG